MTTGITVDSQAVTIPLEMLDAPGKGLAVLTLARGAYLLMRPEMLAAYPRQQLLEFSQTARALERTQPEEGVTFTRRKQRALQEMRQKGYRVSAGLEYGLQPIAAPNVTLDQVWQGLATIRGTLTEEVLAEREER